MIDQRNRLDIMISVNPPYSKMILNGYKPFEFREKILKEIIRELTPSPFHESKNIKAFIYETKNKGGVGKVIGDINIVDFYQLHYVDKKYPDTELIEERMNCIKHLYMHWCYMNGLMANMNERWFKSKKFTKYRNDIGWVDQNFNYAIIFSSPEKYNQPISLSKFINAKGDKVIRPPQNMCKVWKMNQ